MKQFLETIVTVAVIALVGYLLWTHTPVGGLVNVPGFKAETVSAAPVRAPAPQIIFQTAVPVQPVFQQPLPTVSTVNSLPVTIVIVPQAEKNCTYEEWAAAENAGAEIGCTWVAAPLATAVPLTPPVPEQTFTVSPDGMCVTAVNPDGQNQTACTDRVLTVDEAWYTAGQIERGLLKPGAGVANG